MFIKEMYLYVVWLSATVFVVSQMYNRRYCKFYQFSIRLSKWIRDTYFWTMHIFFNEINIELFYSFWRNKRLVSRIIIYLGSPDWNYIKHYNMFIWDHQDKYWMLTTLLKMVSHASLFSILAQLLFHTYKFIYFIIPQQER